MREATHIGRGKECARAYASADGDCRRVAAPMRRTAAEQKYAAAVALYASSTLPVRAIAERCGVTATGLSTHISQYHRELLFRRYGLDATDESLRGIKVKPRRGQSVRTHLKYKEAIEACGDVAFIEFNISQIARMFGLSGTALAFQLKVHYPEIIPFRERLRQRLGIADNIQRGARQVSAETYREAMEMYRDTDLSIPEVARVCNVPQGGLSQYLRFYHKDVIDLKSARRQAANAPGTRTAGALSGNGKPYGPRASTEALYAPALELYRDTALTIKEISERTGVPAAGLTAYLRQWHKGEMLRRRGYEWNGTSEPDLEGTRAFLRSTARKYAPAIESLRENPRDVARVAADFGLNPEVFREYLRSHQPELAERHGMTRSANGRLVKRSSAEKYAAAIQEYASSTDSLRSIAQRHGIVYNSISGYVARNCPEERERHRRLLERSQAS